MATTPPDTGPYIRVDCLTTFDPPWITVSIFNAPIINVPKPVYDRIRGLLGLPDVVCGEG